MFVTDVLYIVCGAQVYLYLNIWSQHRNSSSNHKQHAREFLKGLKIIVMVRKWYIVKGHGMTIVKIKPIQAYTNENHS